jgi:hypothetical protein
VKAAQGQRCAACRNVNGADRLVDRRRGIDWFAIGLYALVPALAQQVVVRLANHRFAGGARFTA